MPQPVFVVCQGRTGGTHLADCIARATGGTFLYEPLHPRLLRNVQDNPERTNAKLGHATFRWPNRGYQHLHFPALVRLHCPQGSKDSSVVKWLDYLAHYCDKPVFKLCRLFGRLHLLREAFPAARIVHLWRDWPSQSASYADVGFTSDYFGNGTAYGLPPGALRQTWDYAKREGRMVADISLAWDVVLHEPRTAAGCLQPVLGLEDAERTELVRLLGQRGMV